MNIPFLRPARRHSFCSAGGALCAAAALLALPAAAQPMPAVSQIPPQVLARAVALASEAASALAPPGARVTAQAGTLDPRLQLAPCARVEPYLGSGVPAWGRSRVGLRCTDGAVRWNVFLPVTVQVIAPALVSTGALPAGARLTEGQLAMADIDWAAATQPPFSQMEVLNGRTLVRAVLPGQALRAADLQPRQWFAQGDTVQIIAAGAGFSIHAEGQALSPGLDGQPVRIRTDTGRVLVGRAVAERRVEVGL